MRLGWLGCFVFVAGCSSVDAEGLRCDARRPCPSPLSCFETRCVSEVPAAGPMSTDAGQPARDAGPADLGPPDLGPADAGPPDFGPARELLIKAPRVMAVGSLSTVGGLERLADGRVVPFEDGMWSVKPPTVGRAIQFGGGPAVEALAIGQMQLFLRYGPS